MTTRKPTEDEMAVLRNLESGKSFEYGLPDTLSVPAMFACVLAGWADRNRITAAGRAVLALAPPASKGPAVTISVLPTEKPKRPILLPPKGGWGTLPS